MITYIDSNNKQNYTVLFNKASAILGLTPIIKEVYNEKTLTYDKEYYRRQKDTTGKWTEVKLNPETDLDSNGNILVNGKPLHGISSLNDYYQHITDLASLAIGTGRTGAYPWLLRLPLDEPYFEIDANTRAINVPSSLKQIGVRGDKLAEVIFFKIDRYYDAIDLDTRQIYIEWELPDGSKGVSRDFLRDTQSEKDKIIFGWAIGDELTSQVGTIRFSVRFVEWNHGADTDPDAANKGTELAYSFSSLPAQVAIVDSLNLSLFENDEETKMIKTDDQVHTYLFYLENSDPDSAGEETPTLSAIPVFIRDLNKDVTGNARTADTGTDKSGKQFTYYEDDLEDDNSLELMVEAYAPDGGNISYIFGRRDTLEDGTAGIPAQIKFKEIQFNKDSKLDDNTLYFEKADNGIYVAVDHNTIKDALKLLDDGANVTYYERVAFITVSGPGFYFANARNSAGGKKVSSANSYFLYVPYASEAKIDARMPERFVINETTETIGLDPTIDQSLRAYADSSNIKITTSNPGPATLELGVTAPKFSAEKTKGLTYTWYRDPDIYDDKLEKMKGTTVGEDGANHPKSDAFIVATNSSGRLTIDKPGYYVVKVDNFYNNDHTEIDYTAAGHLRVTNMPVIPTINFADWEQTMSAGNTSASIEVEYTDNDKITYEWHKVTNDSSDMDPVAEKDMGSPKGELKFVDGKASIPFTPMTEGDYYFILTNELNGAKVSMNSATTPGMGMIVVRATSNNG